VDYLSVSVIPILPLLISRAPCRVRVYLLGAPSQISNQRATKVSIYFFFFDLFEGQISQKKGPLPG